MAHPALREPGGPAPGLTLIEVVVVLVLLGLAAALVAPTLAPPRPAPADPLAAAAASARALALRRAEPLRFAVALDGAWTVTSDGGSDSLRAVGRLDAVPRAPLVLRISPLGACTADPPAVWDAATCTPAP